MSHSEKSDPSTTSNQVPGTPASTVLRGTKNVPLAMVWAVAVGTAGGFFCGLAVSRFGTLGSISLWALGALGGHVSRKIVTTANRLVAWTLVVACGSALVIAEVCWIHWNTRQGSESWWKAFTLLSTFVQEYERAALIAVIFTVFGAWSAYRQTAVRYRLVAVEEDISV